MFAGKASDAIYYPNPIPLKKLLKATCSPKLLKATLFIDLLISADHPFPVPRGRRKFCVAILSFQMRVALWIGIP